MEFLLLKNLILLIIEVSLLGELFLSLELARQSVSQSLCHHRSYVLQVVYEHHVRQPLFRVSNTSFRRQVVSLKPLDTTLALLEAK